MDEINHLGLLSGAPAKFAGIEVHAPKLNTIRELTFQRYSRLTNLLTISQMDLDLFYDQQKISDDVPTPFEYLHSNCLKEPLFFLELQIAFLTYLEKEVVVGFDCFAIETKDSNGEKKRMELNADNFHQFQALIKSINFTQPAPDREFHADKSDAKFVKIFEEARKKLRLAKERERRKQAIQKGSTTNFPDIVSSLCAYGVGYTLFNVWDLTIYQFYDQLYRNRAKETYELNMQLLMEGVDKSKLDLQYWMADITIK